MSRPATLLLLLGILLLAAIAAGLAIHPARFGELSRLEEIRYLEAYSAAALLYAAAIWLVCKARFGLRSLLLVFAVAILARLAVIPAAPFNSNDIYRYVWDGRVQAAGINPYRYLPVDPALALLRDEIPGPSAIYPNVNRATYAPTIYPPTAQALFALVGLTAPSIWTIKAVMAACDLLTGVILLLVLRAAGRPPAHVLIWLWNPLPIWEYANGGHIDSPGITLSALAIYAAIRLRPTLAGAALGAAVMVKFLPAALFPALWRRWDLRTPLAAAATILAGYACYASVGWRVFGFLGGYVQEEGLDTGTPYLLLRLAALATPLPPYAARAYLAACLAGLAALSLWIVRRPLPADLAARADVIGWTASLLGLAIIAVLSPHLPWYLGMLAMPAVLTPRPGPQGWSLPATSVLWPTFVGTYLYMDFAMGHAEFAALTYLPCLPLLWLDLRSRRRSRSLVPA